MTTALRYSEQFAINLGKPCIGFGKRFRLVFRRGSGRCPQEAEAVGNDNDDHNESDKMAHSQIVTGLWAYHQEEIRFRRIGTSSYRFG